jgi:hypothetical protein
VVAARAKTLFTTRFGWTSLSVGRLPGTGRWILLNQKAGSIDDNHAHNTWNEPIVARIVATPWDIESAAEIRLFDPVRDAHADSTWPRHRRPRRRHGRRTFRIRASRTARFS